jgi:hypothetical protein
MKLPSSAGPGSGRSIEQYLWIVHTGVSVSVVQGLIMDVGAWGRGGFPLRPRRKKLKS